ncbi:MAG: sugar transferase [Lachnospiraceae bacterium]
MYKERAKGWMKHLDFILMDLFILQISFLVAYMMRHGIGNPYADQAYLSVAILIELFDLILILALNSYKNVLKRGYYKEFVSTLQQAVGVVAVTALFFFLIKMGEDYSRVTIFAMGGFYLVLDYSGRIILKKIVCSSLKARERDRLLVITDSVMLNETMKGIRNKDLLNLQLIGVALVDQQGDLRDVEEIHVVANQSTLMEYLSHAWIDEVFLNVAANTDYIKNLVKDIREMGLTLHVGVMPMLDEMGQQQKVGNIGEYLIVTNGVNYMSPLDSFLKRALDICGGLVGCAITVLLALILGPMIYIQSPGPIFFKQERVGRNGRRFYMYKFRSMYLDAEDRKQELLEQNRVKDGMMFKLDWDPRIIGSKILPDGTLKKGLGNYMRDWSLDEFPQFFNVLKGEMSLVGTRPPTVDEWEKYESHHRIRLAMRPGITGLWQISGRSNITDFEEVVALDTKYIVDWDLGQDIKILLKTIWVVFHKDGAM